MSPPTPSPPSPPLSSRPRSHSLPRGSEAAGTSRSQNESTHRPSPAQTLPIGQSQPLNSAAISRPAAVPRKLRGKKPIEHSSSESEADIVTTTTRLSVGTSLQASRPPIRQSRPPAQAQKTAKKKPTFIVISDDTEDEVQNPEPKEDITQASMAAGLPTSQGPRQQTLPVQRPEPQSHTPVYDSPNTDSDNAREDRPSQLSKVDETRTARKRNQIQLQNLPEIVPAARKSSLRSALAPTTSEPPLPTQKRMQQDMSTMSTRRTRNQGTVPTETQQTRSSSSLTPIFAEPKPAKFTSNTKPLTNIEVYNINRRQIAEEINERIPAIRESLMRHLSEMRKDHAYIVKNSLAAARLDLDQLAKPQNNPIGIGMDEVSPFAGMKGIEIAENEQKPKGIEVEKFMTRTLIKHHSWAEQYFFVPVTIAETPKDLAKVPKYHSYTTLRSNILAEDDDIMRYIPYFGEELDETQVDDINLEEAFEDRTKLAAEEGKKAEWAQMYSYFIEEFLKEFDLTFEGVTRYLIGSIKRLHGGIYPAKNEQIRKDSLPEDFNPSAPNLVSLREKLGEATVQELESAEPVCKVFKEVTKISLWEVIKITNETVKNSFAPNKVTGSGVPLEDEGKGKVKEKGDVAALTGGNPRPYSLESYSALSCVLCYMHECPYHVNKDQDRLAMAAAEEANPGKSSRKSGDGLIMNFPTSLPGWSSSNKGVAINPWGDMETKCSPKCFVKAPPEKINAPLTDWTQAQLDLFSSSVGVLKNNPRCACMMVPVINKPCYEIYHRLLLKDPSPDPETPVDEDLHQVSYENKNKSRGRRNPTALKDYPPDCDKTHIHDRRAQFQACRHLGFCDDACPCVQSHVTCEKSCTCSANCRRRWRGCNCKREGSKTCSPDKCPCVKGCRECDPDLCGGCGAAEALDPVNRYDPSFTTTHCQNIVLQRDMPKRTLLGISSVAGFGLLMGEDVKAGEFLGEYKGEVISSEEAERRGKVYDRRGVSFLFNLNQNQVIDATRAGNKFRYVNHSSKRPNCHAKVLMANCTHRIGMYAKKDIQAGEELFFDYGSVFVDVMRARGSYRELEGSDADADDSYSNKTVKFVQKEPPDMSNLNLSAADATTKKKGKAKAPNLAYLSGGKGTTLRTKAKLQAENALGGTVQDGTAGPGPANFGSRRYDEISRRGESVEIPLYIEDTEDEDNMEMGNLDEPEAEIAETEEEVAHDSEEEQEEYRPEHDEVQHAFAEDEDDEEDEEPRSSARRRRNKRRRYK